MADFLEMPDKANELIIGDGSCRTYPQGNHLLTFAIRASDHWALTCYLTSKKEKRKFLLKKKKRKKEKETPFGAGLTLCGQGRVGCRILDPDPEPA